MNFFEKALILSSVCCLSTERIILVLILILIPWQVAAFYAHMMWYVLYLSWNLLEHTRAHTCFSATPLPSIFCFFCDFSIFDPNNHGFIFPLVGVVREVSFSLTCVDVSPFTLREPLSQNMYFALLSHLWFGETVGKGGIPFLAMLCSLVCIVRQQPLYHRHIAISDKHHPLILGESGGGRVGLMVRDEPELFIVIGKCQN